MTGLGGFLECLEARISTWRGRGWTLFECILIWHRHSGWGMKFLWWWWDPLSRIFFELTCNQCEDLKGNLFFQKTGCRKMHPSLYFTIYIEILFVSINIGKKFFKLALPLTCTLFVHPSLVEEQFLDVNYKSIFYILSFNVNYKSLFYILSFNVNNNFGLHATGKMP